MKCPACENILSPLIAGKLTVDVCQGGCGGIWFDNFELAKVDDPQEFEGEVLATVEPNESLFIDYTRRRNCPKCDQVVMMRHYFSEQRHVLLDTCPNCNGIWLDAGELIRIRKECSTKADRESATRKYFGRLFTQEFARLRVPSKTTGHRL